MTAARRPRPAFSAATLGAAIFVAVLMAATEAPAKTTGVVDDPALQSGPCYDALIDKNAATPTTAPNRELGAACDAEHGDVDKAWARVIRLWGSDSTDVPDYDSYRRADASPEGAMPKWLAALGILLTYAVLGAPMRSVARWFGAYPGKPRVGDVAAGLLLRGIVGVGFLVLSVLPYVAAIGAAALIAWTILRLGRSPPPPAPSTASRGARLADALNDAFGVWPSLAALALFAQPSGLVLALSLAAAIVASAGPVIAARRALRATPLSAAVASAALAAALGEALVLAPPVAGWLGGLSGAALIVPLGAAGLTLAAGLALARPGRFASGGA